MKSNWNTVFAGSTATLLVMAAANARADHGYGYERDSATYDYAEVLSVEPNVRHVTVTTPVRECRDEIRYYTVDERRPPNFAGALFGAVLGGVIGHQFGSGSGNDAATVAGALLGAAAGSESGRRSGYAAYGTTEYARPVRRCETRYTTHQEERVDSYRVIYRYNGRKYATDTPFDPGERIRIRVEVRPVP
jgi:uncharacterized protein YcfJ